MADFKEILKHSGNYLIANLATRALAFISIPVYTRILSADDYGVTAVFMGVVMVLAALIALNMDSAVGRYYYDRKSGQDFRQFVGTTIIASFVIILFTSTLFYLSVPRLVILLKLPLNAVYLLIPIAVINLIGQLFVQIYQPQRLSKQVAVSSLVRVYLGFVFSIGLILLFKSEKYIGQLLGQFMAGSVMVIYWYRKISPFVALTFKTSHLKYILNFSVPLIPYILSGVLIEQFGKITLGTTSGLAEAGFYSLALSVSSIAVIATEITHQAWYPYYFEYMNTRNYEQHDKDLKRIFKITLVVGMFVSSFGYEIGILLAKKDFTSALYLVPVLVFGYIFHQLSYAYMRNVSFVRKTIYMSLIVIASGVSNILLNILMIPKWGELGAALSFVFSYMLMAFIAWSISNFMLKIHSISIIKLLPSFFVYTVFIILLAFVLNIEYTWYNLWLKLFLFLLLVLILLWKDKEYIYDTLRTVLNKRK